MATMGFIRRDFDVFAIEDFSARLAKIDELVTPRLMRLAPEFNRDLSRDLHMDFYPHIARHMRRAATPPMKRGQHSGRRGQDTSATDISRCASSGRASMRARS